MPKAKVKNCNFDKEEIRVVSFRIGWLLFAAQCGLAVSQVREKSSIAIHEILQISPDLLLKIMIWSSFVRQT